ncbi:insulin receptor substrate 1-like [Aphis gossypii]|uniref:insulin receptor substrate 1-like n=1 Tax=Aphis gossypii TaxID=80765 RepID=UPI00215905C9|nr:insulin receptor substrate 1-like [Aphis gossypii]
MPKWISRIANVFIKCLPVRGQVKKQYKDYVCQISILKKELGLNKNLLGMTRLRICDTKISIINYTFKSEEQNSIDIMISSITDVGVDETIFYIFLKDDSPLGYGQLWMETYDTKISLKLHDIIRETFYNKTQKQVENGVPLCTKI